MDWWERCNGYSVHLFFNISAKSDLASTFERSLILHTLIVLSHGVVPESSTSWVIQLLFLIGWSLHGDAHWTPHLYRWPSHHSTCNTHTHNTLLLTELDLRKAFHDPHASHAPWGRMDWVITMGIRTGPVCTPVLFTVLRRESGEKWWLCFDLICYFRIMFMGLTTRAAWSCETVGRTAGTVVASERGGGALMALTVSGLEVVWASWVRDCCEFNSVIRRAGRLFCSHTRTSNFNMILYHHTAPKRKLKTHVSQARLSQVWISVWSNDHACQCDSIPKRNGNFLRVCVCVRGKRNLDQLISSMIWGALTSYTLHHLA